jgi:hypothetical protein
VRSLLPATLISATSAILPPSLSWKGSIRGRNQRGSQKCDCREKRIRRGLEMGHFERVAWPWYAGDVLDPWTSS